VPLFPVVWEQDGREVHGYLLCAACDDAETRELAREADGR
jgi:hypothetical protein